MEELAHQGEGKSIWGILSFKSGRKTLIEGNSLSSCLLGLGRNTKGGDMEKGGKGELASCKESIS